MKDTRAQIVVIDDHRVVGLGVKAAFEAQCADASISWYPTVPDAPWEHGQVAVLDLRLADGSAPDENIADINGRGVPVVVYTSGDDPYLVRRAIAGGALSIVRKSAPPEDLVEAPDPRLGGRLGRRRGLRRLAPVGPGGADPRPLRLGGALGLRRPRTECVEEHC